MLLCVCVCWFMYIYAAPVTFVIYQGFWNAARAHSQDKCVLSWVLVESDRTWPWLWPVWAWPGGSVGTYFDVWHPPKDAEGVGGCCFSIFLGVVMPWEGWYIYIYNILYIIYIWHRCAGLQGMCVFFSFAQVYISRTWFMIGGSCCPSCLISM